MPTFREAAEALIETKRRTWRGDNWTPTLRMHAYPTIGDLPVDKVTTEAILSFLEPLWLAKPEMASRVRMRVESVLDSAKVRGWRTDPENPARWQGHLEYLLPAKDQIAPVQNRPAMPWQEVPGFVSDLAKRDEAAALALRFTILTAARSDEVLGATWQEIDMEAATWTIPGSRMKGAKKHVVPLSEAALAILKGVRGNRKPEPDDWVFPSKRGKNATMGHDAMRRVLYAIGRRDITVHGFRSSFRDWCAENHKPHDVAEFCLAHVKGGTEGAYYRTTMIDARSVLMAEWAAFCITNN
jgi:integrase